MSQPSMPCCRGIKGRVLGVTGPGWQGERQPLRPDEGGTVEDRGTVQARRVPEARSRLCEHLPSRRRCPGRGQSQGVSFVSRNQDRTFLCCTLPSWEILFMSCFAPALQPEPLSLPRLLSLSLSPPLCVLPVPSSAAAGDLLGERQHNMLILAHPGWTFNPSVLPTPGAARLHQVFN